MEWTRVGNQHEQIVTADLGQSELAQVDVAQKLAQLVRDRLEDRLRHRQSLSDGVQCGLRSCLSVNLVPANWVRGLFPLLAAATGKKRTVASWALKLVDGANLYQKPPRHLRHRRLGHVFDRSVALSNVSGCSWWRIYDTHPAVVPWTLDGYVRAWERAVMRADPDSALSTELLG
jgi:hypothetical protein